MTRWCPEAELHIWQGMAHVFPANLALVWAAREALDIAGEFLRRHLTRVNKIEEHGCQVKDNP